MRKPCRVEPESYNSKVKVSLASARPSPQSWEQSPQGAAPLTQAVGLCRIWCFHPAHRALDTANIFFSRVQKMSRFLLASASQEWPKKNPCRSVINPGRLSGSGTFCHSDARHQGRLQKQEAEGSLEVLPAKASLAASPAGDHQATEGQAQGPGQLSCCPQPPTDLTTRRLLCRSSELG